MRWYKEAPEEGDLVVVTITDVDKNSAYAELDEYKDRKGLIHISEVSRSWVQDVTKVLREGEKTVAQVVEAGDGTLGLSLKRVNDRQKKDTMGNWNREKKAGKFVSQLADELGEDEDDLYEDVVFPMQREFGSAFTGFEVSVGEEEKLLELFDEETVEVIQKVARENINLKQEKFEGEIILQYLQPDGIERIKKTLKDLGDGVEVKYVSAPKYSITAWGRNTELAKKRMDKATKKVEKKTDELDGEYEFQKV
jgi:translation initiation factor 2 subunit 1